MRRNNQRIGMQALEWNQKVNGREVGYEKH